MSDFWVVFFWCWGILWFFMGLEIFFAHQDAFFSQRQLDRKVIGFPDLRNGLPFTKHYGMISDIPLSIVVSWAAGLYFTTPRSNSFKIVPLLIGVVVSTLMHQVWKKDGVKNPTFVTYRDRITAAGYAHFIYMIIVLTLLLDFYFWMDHSSMNMVLWISFALLIHLFFGIAGPNIHRGESVFKKDTILVFSVAFIAIALANFYVWKHLSS